MENKKRYLTLYVEVIPDEPIAWLWDSLENNTIENGIIVKSLYEGNNVSCGECCYD